MSELRYNPNVLGVQGARPYGAGGVVPSDAVVTGIKPHGRGVPYYSDRPFEQPYNDRPTCAGTRTDGKPCKAKAEPALEFCKAHNPEG